MKYNSLGATVYIFNEATGIEHYVHLFASQSHPEGRGVDEAIALARSLYQ